MVSNLSTLRRLIEEQEITVAPGVYDALTAKMAEKVGFKALFQTGFGTAASLLGEPDLGLLTMAEMADRAGRIARAVNVPVIGDGDTGYGNPLNVIRTVREFERQGAAGLILEDQRWPKRCGHLTGKQVVDPQEAEAKIRAALEARDNPDFIIVARTDAREPLGLEEAIRRAKMFEAAGADVIFVEALRSVEEMRTLTRSVKTPCLANMVEGGLTPLLSVKELAELGFRIAVFPISILLTVYRAAVDVLRELLEKGTTASKLRSMAGFEEFNELVDLPRWLKLEKRYATEEAAPGRSS